MNDLNLSRKSAARMRSGGLLALFLLAGWPAMVTPLRADNPPTYLFQIDSSAVPGGFQPFFLALDSSNNIYVTDLNNDRVYKFDSRCNYLNQWGNVGSGNGQFNRPTFIALDSNDNVYVIDEGNNRIEKFDSNGNYLTQWGSYGIGNGQFESPNGIAVDSNNNVYVADNLFNNNRVEKFSSDGNYLTQWGSYGIGNGQFENLNGIAVDSGNNVYVTDSGNGRIDKFTSNGNYLTQWGSFGSGSGQFDEPQGIAVDSSNHVYVADSDNSRVEKFGSNGNYLTQWGSYGNGNGQFYSPDDVAVDSTGNFVYVTDGFRIQAFVYNANIVPPVITSEPSNQLFSSGINMSFSVGVVGTPPFSYQWMSNNMAVLGATNATFTLSDVGLADTGAYSVLVANDFGSNLSSSAMLLPAVAITQSATGISPMGAVLNGSVTIGSENTTVWFEWGTNADYGNIAGTALLPGNSGSNNLSAAVNGLVGNVYHYRIDASNDFGIAYGTDQVFAVGLRPTATTLSVVNTTNGSSWSALVNPNGLDTTVYFKWGVSTGPFTYLTNSTPVMDVGGGATPLNVSSFITGVAEAKQYDYQVVASNYLGSVFGAQVAFYSPPFVGVPNENWDSVASSADGSVLVAVANSANGASPAGPIIISTNSGVTWTIAPGAPTNGLWETVACSADGTKMIAAGGGGGSYVFPIYTSSDMGATWVSNNAPVVNWQSVASSADGTRLVAAAELNQVIYTSTNSGAVWMQATNAPKVRWFSVALSADGTKLAAVANGSPSIFTSPDFGTTWITNKVPVGPPQGIQVDWSSIASSADGNKLIAAAGGNGASGFIFISTNSGAAWTVTATNIVSGFFAHPWIGVASSADGSKLAAVSDATSPQGVLITSTDSGATWTTNAVPFLDWNAVALSADGAKLVASVGYPLTGPIYVSQTTPSPVLSLAPGNGPPTVSWIIPSMGFTLQQSSDLSNWAAVTNAPVLNPTNLENQVALPFPGDNSFFRLKSN